MENYPLNSNYLTWRKHKAPREYLQELLKESRKGVWGGILRRGSFVVWRNNEEGAGSRGYGTGPRKRRANCAKVEGGKSTLRAM